MAVPKKRTGHSAQGKRRSNWKATKPTLTTCPNCGQKVLAHTVCTACGQYKGKVVSRKSEGFVEAGAKEEVKETKKAPAKKSTAKKTTKKSTKPAEEVVEVKETEVVEEAKAEETSAEEKTEE